jgi:hypothetical protein
MMEHVIAKLKSVERAIEQCIGAIRELLERIKKKMGIAIDRSAPIYISLATLGKKRAQRAKNKRGRAKQGR